MSFANFRFGFALAAFLFQDALGNPVSTSSSAGMYGAISSSLTSVTRGVCDATPMPYSCLSSATCTRTICVDNINECGKMYGGCFLDPVCTGGTAWPTFAKPPCPTTTSPITSSSSACTQSICQDFVNECGQGYGGCFLDPKCTGGSIYPTFTPPPCPSPTSKPSSKSLTCTRSICVDNINECGLKYGGCFLDPQCTGGSVWPTFTKPPCPTASSSSSTPCPTSASNSTIYTHPTTATCPHSICVDGVDECGQAWGGCYLAPECGGPKTEPSFTMPYCVPTVPPTAIETVTLYTSFPLVTVTSTSTSHYLSSISSTVPSTNGTRISTPSPTRSPPAAAFTGSAVRDAAGFGILAAAAAAAAAGALFL